MRHFEMFHVLENANLVYFKEMVRSTITDLLTVNMKQHVTWAGLAVFT